MAPSTHSSLVQPQLLLSIGLILCIGTAIMVEGVEDQTNFQKDMVETHNAVRKSMGIGPLTWNATVAAYAQSYAKQRADCQLVHSHGPYGENIFWAVGAGIENAKTAVNSWFGEKTDYDYASNTCASGKVCGHYTQVVWRNSKSLGCSYTRCSTGKGGYWVVCSYYPPGNYVGEKPY